MGFKYVKMEKSIEDTSFEYITNLDDYKAMYHVLTVLSTEKIKKPILAGIFKKIVRMIDETIQVLSKITKSDGKSIDVGKLSTYMKNKSTKKILLVKNEDYNSFASYVSNFEDDKIEHVVKKTVLYNVGQLETSGSISIIPSNANVFLSSLLYSYTLLFSEKFYQRQNIDIFVNVTKIYYTVILGSFGKKSGLLVGSRKEKEFLFFLCASFVYSIYSKEEKKNSDNLKAFLRVAASHTGSSYVREYEHKISNVMTLYKPNDVFNPENYNSLSNLARVAKGLKILEVSESEIKIQLFRLLGVYGILGVENYIRFVAYMVATYIPNAYFASTLKVYNKSSYEFLVEYYTKELFSF